MGEEGQAMLEAQGVWCIFQRTQAMPFARQLPLNESAFMLNS
jgi:hypothetical protein